MSRYDRRRRMMALRLGQSSEYSRLSHQRFPADEGLINGFYESLGLAPEMLPDDLTNAWPESIELGFQQRARRVLEALSQRADLRAARERKRAQISSAIIAITA